MFLRTQRLLAVSKAVNWPWCVVFMTLLSRSLSTMENKLERFEPAKVFN
jgi:hypothetical protein